MVFSPEIYIKHQMKPRRIYQLSLTFGFNPVVIDDNAFNQSGGSFIIKLLCLVFFDQKKTFVYVLQWVNFTRHATKFGNFDIAAICAQIVNGRAIFNVASCQVIFFVAYNTIVCVIRGVKNVSLLSYRFYLNFANADSFTTMLSL